MSAMSTTGAARLDVLGRVRVHGPSGTSVEIGRSQVAAVAAMLWIERRPVRRDDLAELLWGDWNLPRHWAGAVRGVLTKLRQVLAEAGFPAEVLRSNAGVVELDLDAAATTDVEQAESLIERALAARDDGDLHAACAAAEAAAQLLSQPLAVETEGEWLRRLHLRVDTFGAEARRVHIETLLAAGRITEAAAEAAQVIERDPLDEAAGYLLIEAHLAAGRPAAARRVYGDLADSLEAELGITPARDLTDLIDEGTPTIDHPVAVADPDPSTVLLGRRDELAVLHARLAAVVSGRRPELVLVTGPAGIGKTRLVTEFVESIEATVLWGRCHADAGEPFEPFADAFRRFAGGEDPAWQRLDEPTRETVDTVFGVPLDRTVPRPMSVRSAGGRPDRAGSRATRAAVIRRTVRTMEAVTRSAPMILVLDDLHWAAGDTLGLAERILTEVGGPVLVVASARDEVARPAGFSELLRATKTTVVELDAVTRDELRPLGDDLRAVVAEPVDAEAFITQLWERTGGLPYYVAELVGVARRRRRFEMGDVPDHVRAWVRHRVESLPAEDKAIAELAAVTGSRPSVDLVEACWVGSSVTALSALERLVRGGFLVETGDVDTVAFAHEITREVIEAGIGAPRRARLHSTVADHLAREGEAGAPRPARIAYHLARSGPGRHREAARYGYLAGVESITRGAWDLADDQFTGALALLDDTSDPLAAAVLVARGWTRHARGDAAGATELLDRAGQLATRGRLPHEAARAVLLLVGRGGRGAAYTMGDDERVARLRAVRRAIASWDLPHLDHTTTLFPVDAEALESLSIALDVELAWALLFNGSFAERRTLTEGALRRARTYPIVPGRLGRALLAQRNILAGPGQSDRRLAVIDELFTLPLDRLGEDILVNSYLARHEELLVRGDRAGARDAIGEARRVVNRYAHPYWRWATATWESLWSVLTGDPDRAEAELADAVREAPAGSAEAAACWAVQMVAIRLAQGRAEEMVESVRVTAEANPHIRAYRAVSALVSSLAGDRDGARADYVSFAERDFADVPIDSNRLLTLAVLGDVAADIADVHGASVLDALLAPDDDLMVVLNCYGGGGSWWGPVARVRARLADVTGRPDDAAAARKRATVALERLGASALGQPGLDP